MVAQTKQTSLLLATYFEHEDTAEIKSEYHDGVLVAMAGASPTHIRITTNLTRLSGNQLGGQSCEPFDSDMRVLAQACNAVFYPDLTVVCDTPHFADTRMATLLNPALIVEVLSPSTERVDRGMKFDCYRAIESLHAYVLISQDEPRVELYSRQSDGSWRYDVATGLQAILPLDTIGCEIRLAEAYARVVFPSAPTLEIQQ
jgi:Uma2 family endonuclease